MHFWDDACNFGTVPWRSLSLAVWLLIALALVFDFLNGFHDAANSVATVVSTRVLTPQAAVVWAAFFNFVAFLVFHLTVAGDDGQGDHRPRHRQDTDGHRRHAGRRLRLGPPHLVLGPADQSRRTR